MLSQSFFSIARTPRESDRVTASLLDLIRKRHDGDAWIVLTEVANGTGAQARRRADALAIGLWPSHGLPIIGYEVKIARSDVQRELKDPSKAEAIGRFADEWWIVISDVSIIDGLVLPATWGVLAPRKNVLRIVRKAKKLKPEPINRALLAALIRNVCGSWVPRAQYDQLAHKQRAEIVRELERDSESIAEASAQDLKRLRETIEAFEKASGLSIHRWDAGDIGAAVKLALSARTARGRDDLEHSIQQFERTQEHHARVAKDAKVAAQALRELRDARAQRPNPAHDDGQLPEPPKSAADPRKNCDK